MPRARLLLAEDNPVNQRVAGLMLERMGYSVDIVGDGAAAVTAVASGRYDAVLMDCQMPVMDGYEATARIRRNERDGDRIPILALTASALDADREACLSAGMDDHLPKPIRPEPLARTLARILPAGRIPAQYNPSTKPTPPTPPTPLSANRSTRQCSHRFVTSPVTASRNR